MELNVSELYPKQNYWENSTSTTTSMETKRKKKVSFDDILSNMNLVVNQQGVLQYMSPNAVVEQHPDYAPQYQQQQQPWQQQQPSPLPVEPGVKHSYIYNKYFKNYVDPNINVPAPRVPRTIEEYRQMVLEDRMNAIRQKQRIDQIKSKKLLFTSTPGPGPDPRHIQATKNSLRMMSFH